MFKIVQNRTFTHDVPVMVPINGGHQEDTLKTTFNYVDADRLAAFDLATGEGTDQFLEAVINCFHDCVDEAGNQLPYSDALRKQLLGMHNVRGALTRHYVNAVRKTKEGN